MDGLCGDDAHGDGQQSPQHDGGAVLTRRRGTQAAGPNGGSLVLVRRRARRLAHGYVRATVYAPDDAAATAENVAGNASLVRFGFLADLAQATLMLFVVLALDQLLRHVNRSVARAMVVFVTVSVAITCLNMVNQLGAVLVATKPAYAGAFGVGGTDALVLLLLDLQHNGYLIAQIFFGLRLFLLGLLAYRSGMFPRLIGGPADGGGCRLPW